MWSQRFEANVLAILSIICAVCTTYASDADEQHIYTDVYIFPQYSDFGSYAAISNEYAMTLGNNIYIYDLDLLTPTTLTTSIGATKLVFNETPTKPDLRDSTISISNNNIAIIGAPNTTLYKDENGYNFALIIGYVYVFELLPVMDPEVIDINSTTNIEYEWIQTAVLFPTDVNWKNDFLDEYINADISDNNVIVTYSDQSIYTFEKDLINGEWIHTHTLFPFDNEQYNHQYDESYLKIYDNFIMFGVPWKQVNGTRNMGAVYIYENIDNSWIKTQTITPQDLDIDDSLKNYYFGKSLTMNDNLLVITNGKPVIHVYIKEEDNNNGYTNWLFFDKIEMVRPSYNLKTVINGYNNIFCNGHDYNGHSIIYVYSIDNDNDVLFLQQSINITKNYGISYITSMDAVYDDSDYVIVGINQFKDGRSNGLSFILSSNANTTVPNYEYSLPTTTKQTTTTKKTTTNNNDNDNDDNNNCCDNSPNFYPTTSPTSLSDGNNGNSNGNIEMGGIIAIVVSIIFVFFIGFLYYYYNNKRIKQNVQGEGEGADEDENEGVLKQLEMIETNNNSYNTNKKESEGEGGHNKTIVVPNRPTNSNDTKNITTDTTMEGSAKNNLDSTVPVHSVNYGENGQPHTESVAQEIKNGSNNINKNNDDEQNKVDTDREDSNPFIIFNE